MFKKDNIQLGLILGIIAPIAGLIIYYYLKFYPTYSLNDFLAYFFRNKKLITAVGSICLIANVALFTLFINARRDLTAKGIFITTLIYGIAVLLVKVIR